ncbi:RagB/SusD family nutrient uptake outer membrane protein [Chitinophaga pinensis]|uniref:RagB/SusD family nutrient uptake outer membrane protein n=1 Tax=Chitinophaga pinensis TaxID=79329 RepID=A0A5C6LK89_9BACT|nr:RagB/SusD family nutrient uptake outer membrane protein [Chitinophaga pinensis]
MICRRGHRWYDLRRSGKVNEVMTAIRNGQWQATDTLWPIPSSQILLNPALEQIRDIIEEHCCVAQRWYL